MELLSTGNVFFFLYSLPRDIEHCRDETLNNKGYSTSSYLYIFASFFNYYLCELIRINKPDKYYLNPITRTFDSKVLLKQIFHLYDKHFSSFITRVTLLDLTWNYFKSNPSSLLNFRSTWPKLAADIRQFIKHFFI